MRAFALLLAVSVAPRLTLAQQRQDPEPLRAQVIQRFMENYRRQAGLTDEQYARLQGSVRSHWADRRQLQQREQRTLLALQNQLRPGIAASEDEVTRLLDSLVSIQGERAERLRAEQLELAAYLSPVQRAQLVLAFARLERQIEQLMQRRMENRPARQPD